jgi:hypothetical protein
MPKISARQRKQRKPAQNYQKLHPRDSRSPAKHRTSAAIQPKGKKLAEAAQVIVQTRNSYIARSRPEPNKSEHAERPQAVKST